jgi:anti-sigma factor (TIGR02949 family)
MREVGGLRCDEVLARLSAYVDGELDGPDRAQVRTHLAGCPECARFGAGFEGVLVALRESPKDAFDEGLMARLLDQIEER